MKEKIEEKIFNEIKEKSIKIWNRYNKSFGDYVEEKIKRVNSIQNIEDNFYEFYGMFDCINKSILLNLLSKEAKELIINYENTGKY